MRILITGAGGFIGRHVTAFAEQQGMSVHTMGTRALLYDNAASTRGTHHLIGAVDDHVAIQAAIAAVRPDAIVHVAGSTQTHMPTEMYRVNAVYARMILDAAARTCPGITVVLVGSAAEYGPVPGLDLVNERVECRPISLYGISKYAQTLEGMSVPLEKLSVVVARIFNCVGPGMPTSLALGSFVKQVAAMPPEGGTLVVGDLSAVRDFVSVHEVAAALVRLACVQEVSGQILNVASGVGQTLSDVVAMLRTASARPVVVWPDEQRRGNSAVHRFVGDPSKLRAKGIQIKPAYFPELLPAMLKAAAS